MACLVSEWNQTIPEGQGPSGLGWWVREQLGAGRGDSGHEECSRVMPEVCGRRPNILMDPKSGLRDDPRDAAGGPPWEEEAAGVPTRPPTRHIADVLLNLPNKSFEGACALAGMQVEGGWEGPGPPAPPEQPCILPNDGLNLPREIPSDGPAAGVASGPVLHFVQRCNS